MDSARAGLAPMRVLLNALSLKEGGSVVVLVRLLEAMIARAPTVEWHVIVHPSVAARLPSSPQLRLLAFHWAERTPAHLLFWYNWTLPALVRRLRPDVLFSQTNYLPHRRLSCPTLLLEQHAGHFSSEFQRLMEASLASLAARVAWRGKTGWVRRSVRTASLLTVQTQALADAVVAQAGVPAVRILVIPHGPGLLESAPAPRPWPGERVWRLGYVAKPGVQKNFGVLFEAVRRLRGMNREVVLVLSLDEADAQVRPVRAMIHQHGIDAWIDNRGDVAPDRVGGVYDTLDLFVFPSLCESFGFPMVEAMVRGLPLLVADTPGNREVAGAAGVCFRADDAEDLAGRIASLMDDQRAFEQQGALSLARGRAFSWDRSAESTLAALSAVTR